MLDQFTLQNGLRVVAEKLPHFRSVSVGLWVKAGSMDETPEEGGLSHFIEHMLFKGTERRSARQIAEEMDAIGGQINAFTSKECTCFYAKVTDDQLPVAMDVLCDMLRNAAFDPAELDKERGVVLEEIAMTEDSPEDLVHELLGQAALDGNPLARPILGTEELISGYTREDLARYRAKHYTPENVVLAVAGNYDLQALRELAEKHLGSWQAQKAPERRLWGETFVPALVRREKDIEQIHLCAAFPGVPLGSDDVYPLSVLNNLFGGGMSSRLFQRVREESGLAYTVYSMPTSFPGCGMVALYAGTSPQHAEPVMRLIREETERLLSGGITEEEFVKARQQLRGGFILGQDSVSSHMSAIGRGLLLLPHIQSEDEVLAKIDAVTMEDTMRVARAVFGGDNAASVVGRGANDVPEEVLLWKK